MLQRKRYAFQYGADHVAACFIITEPVKNAFRVRVPDWGAFAGHIREKNDSVRTGRDFGRLSCQLVKVPALSQFLPEPLQCSASAYRTALQEIPARNNMRAENQAFMGKRFIEANAHAAGLPALFLRLTGEIYPGAQGPAGCIKPSGNNRRSFLQPGKP